MSARSGALHEVRPLALHVGLAVVLTVLLAIGIAVAIWFPRTIVDTGSGVVRGMPHADATTQMPKEPAIRDYGIRAHGPNQMPKQSAIRDYGIRAHGPNQMPKR